MAPFWPKPLLTPVLHLRYSPYTWSNVLYVSNFLVRGAAMLQHGTPTAIGVPQLPGGYLGLGHLWSLCVEEQFYLVWPVIVDLVPVRRTLMRIAAALIVARVVALLREPGLLFGYAEFG